MNDADLVELLRKTALLEGDFTLRSGRKSRYYFDKYLFETQPTLLREIARRLAAYVDDSVTRVAGAELGAVALAAALALETERPFVIVRNSRKVGYGTSKLIEGRLTRGDRVLLVEDVVTSGGQAVEAAKALTHEGAEVSQLVAVLDRQEGGREAIEQAGFKFAALFTGKDLGIQP